ncbi:uncharacterized protein HMPREF1541_07659 [Cyphellophora europaea CBS 101466]|uniref:Uncharacterized protein n=1 Tax=Cyphellophora europaea (strain CBS 101466) TaxID=1220924 RepID=W2RNF1_CYPE1|nr:uncharacterized protein HMPREF1541_07659 [Cyphellophora europaea CBS 101466]ETN38036.1 hypothetical protein HMPREF1541_07659 [Cyphellophora europaea CBS 101466]
MHSLLLQAVSSDSRDDCDPQRECIPTKMLPD